jgi:hypothetical protein
MSLYAVQSQCTTVLSLKQMGISEVRAPSLDTAKAGRMQGAARQQGACDQSAQGQQTRDETI